MASFERTRRVRGPRITFVFMQDKFRKFDEQMLSHKTQICSEIETQCHQLEACAPWAQPHIDAKCLRLTSQISNLACTQVLVESARSDESIPKNDNYPMQRYMSKGVFHTVF